MATCAPIKRPRRARNGYVPPPLPPRLAITPGLMRDLSRADIELGRLAGIGQLLPNPHVLIRPFVRREAVLSSKIEGTHATLGELLAVEAGAAVERSPEDLREVANYVVALEHGVRRLKKLPLSLRLVRELHKKLLTGVRGGQARPGEFRKSQVWIGPPGSTIDTAIYVPPPPPQMMEALSEWEKFLHTRPVPPLIQIAMAHYQFEAIHPFLDGNGRIGRLLITLFLVERQILPRPLLYLSAYFEATRSDYYAGLRAVTEQNAWELWLAYFLKGVSNQSDDAVQRANRVLKLVASWHHTAGGSASVAPLRLVDILAENPYCTVKGVAKRLRLAFTSAQRAIDHLQKTKILTEISKGRRNRVYCAIALRKILEEPGSFSKL